MIILNENGIDNKDQLLTWWNISLVIK